MQLSLKERIDILRKRKGLRYSDISQLLGVSTSQAWKYVSGAQKLPAAALPKLEAALGEKLGEPENE
jgi:transcriptional regulator with XRE-family HTH domain